MDAATIEETNRIRVSLGMKPLPVPGGQQSQQAASPTLTSGRDDDGDGEAASTLESRHAEAHNNYKKHMEAEVAKKKREEKAAAVRRARELAQRKSLLEGTGLGEENGAADLGAKAWLMGQKKRQKKIEKARKLEEELAAAEAAAAAAVHYTSKDLAGIKIAHDKADLAEGDAHILTLKDATIDENEAEGDELEDLGLRENEQLADRLQLKKKRPGYNPHEDEDGQPGLLSQYDEEIYGKKSKQFTLDAGGLVAELSDILEQPARKAADLQGARFDDTIGETATSADYLAPSEFKVKKQKKKKSTKPVRQKQYDEDDVFPLEPTDPGNDAMDLDTSKMATGRKRKADADDLMDDDDLQASLAIQRKNALKKRKKTRPEDIAKQLKDQGDEGEAADEVAQEGGLVIGEISEFVAGLSKHEEEEERKPRRRKTASPSPVIAPEDDSMELEDDPSVKKDTTADAVIEEEKAVGEGMGAALALLRERGLIEEAQGGNIYENFRQREEFLARKRQVEAEMEEKARQQRERDRLSGKLDRMSRADREEYARQQNTWRDHQHSRRMAELISSTYRPNVNLKYTDEHGRHLDQKEAFKHLSHQFHGKGSGKGKTEKKLKKIEEEKRREAQSLFDANEGGGMNAATAQQLKKRNEAGVRLG